MRSPVVLNGKASLIDEINVESIIQAYSDLNIDVSRFFKNVTKIQLFECNQTQYKFFSPLNVIMGDSAFYEALEKIDWYYLPWKWEHQIVTNILKKDDRILEIGSGGLGFIEKISSLGYNIIGLEINSKSVEKAKKLGVRVEPIFVEEFANLNSNQFDIVCAFQVLEHICSVKDFLDASIRALKKGGKLIIAVPNNESFIKLDKTPLMNYPPHHVGLWDAHSLSMLENYYPLKLKELKSEPLQDYHLNWFINLQMQNGIGKHISLGKNLFKMLYRNWIKLKQSKIIGHSICAIYEKL